MIKKRIAYIVAAALAAAALTGCYGTPSEEIRTPSSHTDKNDPVSSKNDSQSIADPIPDIVDSTGSDSSEEERTHFETVWDMFDYKDDKSEIEFMSFETDDGVQKLSISSFEEKLRKYGKKAEVQSDGGLYAFDASGAAVAVVPGDDGSVDYQLCDGAVLEAALENKYTQVLKSKSACFGMHLGTSTMLLEIQIPDIEKVESDIGHAGKYVLERDDYRLTVYTNGGECFWFILTVFDNTGSESGTSSTKETSSLSGEPPFVWEQLQQQEKIPLTYDELAEIDLRPSAIFYFKEYEKSNQKYDLTASIDTVDKLNYIIKMLPSVAGPDAADDSEYFNPEETMTDLTMYYYNPKTVEKLIRKHFLPTFKISSIDYKSSMYWNSEKGRFETEDRGFDGFMGEVGSEFYYLKESGYKSGDYYYVNLVPLANYPNAEKMYYEGNSLNNLNMSYITSDFFDIPRVHVKFKQFKEYGVLGNPIDAYTYECVGFSPVDEIPDWLECAAKLFKGNDLANVEMIGKAPVQDSGLDMTLKRTAGVINTPFGKRLYLYGINQNQGGFGYDYTHTITTLGTRGQNDKIEYSVHNFSKLSSGGYYNNFIDLKFNYLVCNDVFSNEKYTYYLEDGTATTYENGETVEEKEVHEESWTLNDKDISEKKFNSAEVVSYFLNTFKGYGKSEQYEFDSLYSCEVEDCITLADYYEMCRVMTD